MDRRSRPSVRVPLEFLKEFRVRFKRPDGAAWPDSPGKCCRHATDIRTNIDNGLARITETDERLCDREVKYAEGEDNLTDIIVRANTNRRSPRKPGLDKL